MGISQKKERFIPLFSMLFISMMHRQEKHSLRTKGPKAGLSFSGAGTQQGGEGHGEKTQSHKCPPTNAHKLGGDFLKDRKKGRRPFRMAPQGRQQPQRRQDPYHPALLSAPHRQKPGRQKNSRTILKARSACVTSKLVSIPKSFTSMRA